jgi:dynein heavy chain
MDFPKENITDETCELLEPYFSAPDYNFEAARKASGNVAGLCNWCRAMHTYHYIAVAVEPKIVMLREAEGELRVAMREKAGAEAKMAEALSRSSAARALAARLAQS